VGGKPLVLDNLGEGAKGAVVELGVVVREEKVFALLVAKGTWVGSRGEFRGGHDEWWLVLGG